MFHERKRNTYIKITSKNSLYIFQVRIWRRPLHYRTVLNTIMLKSKAILNSMRKNGNEYLNTSIIDITTMKSINKRFFNKWRSIIKKGSKKELERKIENPAKYLERDQRRKKVVEHSIIKFYSYTKSCKSIKTI